MARSRRLLTLSRRLLFSNFDENGMPINRAMSPMMPAPASSMVRVKSHSRVRDMTLAAGSEFDMSPCKADGHAAVGHASMRGFDHPSTALALLLPHAGSVRRIEGSLVRHRSHGRGLHSCAQM